MHANVTAINKLAYLKEERTKIEAALTTAQGNVERLEKIPPKVLTEKNKADLTLAIRWRDQMQKRFDELELSIKTIEVGISRTVHVAKSFMSKNGKPMRP